MPHTLLPSPIPMLDALFAGLQERGISTALPCDHVCYRVETEARYEEVCAALATRNTLESEALVGGRKISTFRLTTPYRYKGHTIDALEIPAPKSGSAYKEGWEHAEFVTGAPLASFMAQHISLPFNTRAIDKPLNPEISLQITPAYAVKFHPTSLLEVIAVEKKMGIG